MIWQPRFQRRWAPGPQMGQRELRWYAARPDLWFRADRLDTMFEDSGGTIPSGDTGPVTRWGDIGTRYEGVMALDTRSPTPPIRSEIGGKPSVYFEEGELQINAKDALRNQDQITILAVVRTMSDQGLAPWGRPIFYASTGTAEGFFRTALSVSEEQAVLASHRIDDTTTSRLDGIPVLLNQANVLVGVIDHQQDLAFLQVNATRSVETPWEGVGSISDTDSLLLSIGRGPVSQATRYLTDTHIHELIIFTRRLADREITNFLKYAQFYWGVS